MKKLNLKAFAKRQKEKYRKAGKSEDWLKSWERAFFKEAKEEKK